MAKIIAPRYCMALPPTAIVWRSRLPQNLALLFRPWHLSHLIKRDRRCDPVQVLLEQMSEEGRTGNCELLFALFLHKEAWAAVIKIYLTRMAYFRCTLRGVGLVNRPPKSLEKITSRLIAAARLLFSWSALNWVKSIFRAKGKHAIGTNEFSLMDLDVFSEANENI